MTIPDVITQEMTTQPIMSLRQREVPPKQFRQILGIRFFVGNVHQAVRLMTGGGLLVVPAAPGLVNLPRDAEYREALLNSDLALTDSAMMVLVWNRIEGDRVPRLSGLEYFTELVKQPELQTPGKTFWIMASPTSAATNLKWLRKQKISPAKEDVYVAPYYAETISDPLLLQKIRDRRPDHIIVTIGGGKQEPLGLYLKRNLDYLPGIHCIGAAIAFLSGDQVYIPTWADQLRLGWLFRCVSSPRQYIPRYWGARSLFDLLVKYRDRLPIENQSPLKAELLMPAASQNEQA